ncbi:MAG: MBL fold metallo-hydrolase [Rhodobacteraceae bacterium]|nr:MBL fold metallo-hydrolase [Paracoccaceae bacterium]
MDGRDAAAADGLRYPFAQAPHPGQAVAVADGLLWLRLPLPMALDHVNAFALDDRRHGGDGWTVVDPGMHTPRTVAAWEQALAGPLAGAPVTRVIVTHYHPDHIGMAGWFRARGAELVTPRLGWVTARMLVLDVQDRPLPETLAFWRRAGMPAADLNRRAGQRPFNFADVVAPLPPGFTRLSDGDTLRAAGRDWHVLFGQGHAPDHAVLWAADGDLVLGGDQLLPGISANLSVYAAEPDADPVGEWMAATRAFQPRATGTELVLPGHKLPFTGLPLRLTQMIANHQGALARLHDHLSVPRTAVDCFAPLFAREIGPDTTIMALGEAVAHLNCLARQGMATRAPGPDGADLWQRA